jgi:S-adenosylmethionine:tRNA ribosyltransferase-isomerase
VTEPTIPKPEDFHYELPEELIARRPLERRDGSRMLIVRRAEGTIEDAMFATFPQQLQSGDCIVVNDTRVIPARLYGRRAGHTGQVEVFLLESLNEEHTLWKALVRPGKKLLVGVEVELSERLRAVIREHREHGERVVEFRLDGGGDVDAELERIGHMPLPHYLGRPDEAMDRERYQTVFAAQPGAAAAPTAGLHFTPAILEACRLAGADLARITLHVGLGTFQPLSEENLRTLTLHEERYAVSADAAERLQRARRRIAIGTTSVRTLETVRRGNAAFTAQQGVTDIFITPGFEFRATDALLTNFHLPGSSLMMLVAAFAGRELILRAYEHAVRERYRFFSYGDCMLIV